MIVILDLTGNNLSSLGNAIARLGYDFILSHKEKDIKNASHLILPGVGSALPAMNALNQYNLVPLLKESSQPILGICLGMQLLYEKSEEGDVSCIGLIPGNIQKMRKEKNCPIPHMGWNKLKWQKENPLQKGVENDPYVYFAHSYAALSFDNALAKCEYSDTFTAIVQKDNVYGMQFHPEKSAENGLILLNNFLKLR